MSVDLRLPNITGTDKEQLAQMRSYLYQIIPQLQWALNTVETSVNTVHTVTEVKNNTTSAPSETPAFNAELAFSKLKPLIIKSAEIVEAYYEEINRKLVGEYVAQSDFGTFVEQNELNISQNATDIEQLFSNTQAIITDIENLTFTLAEVNARIKSGILYYDDSGLPVYGLEIGQKNSIDGEEVFRKFARFTSDRLSFYDQNDTEVAYISDYKLYIRSVEITSSYKIGGLVDTVQSNGDVVTKWVERG